MNLFQKYGIKEVADVTFYSINTVGDEEIYTPVLFLDTLKVSTIEKTAEKVQAEGGKGNKKLITWNFGKEITLNLEDALFTPASMSMIWGGQLESKLSPYTSAIVKINMANKYGKLNYSTKAYPSPALTDEEWDIVFKAWDKNNQIVIKNEYQEQLTDNVLNGNWILLRVTLSKNKYGYLFLQKEFDAQGNELWEHHNSIENAHNPLVPYNFIVNKSFDSFYTGYYVDEMGYVYDLNSFYKAKIRRNDTISIGDFVSEYNNILANNSAEEQSKKIAELKKKYHYSLKTSEKVKNPPADLEQVYYLYSVTTPVGITTGRCWNFYQGIDKVTKQLVIREDTDNPSLTDLDKYHDEPLSIDSYVLHGSYINTAVIWGNPQGSQNGFFNELIQSFSIKNGEDFINIPYIACQEITQNQEEILSTITEALKIPNNSILDINAPEIAEKRNNIRKNYFFRTLENNQAMPDNIVNNIVEMIDELKKIGTIETQIYDTEIIDRMEKCIVTSRKGLTIKTSEQKKNLLKYYSNVDTESYTIYYDAKTMLPLLSVTENGMIKGWDADVDPPHDRDFDGKADNDEFVLKLGTVYYKWTRTVKRKDGSNDGILGRTFVIDSETFPDAYKIVGETYIREQKTGKDQRYQFTIHRATVSTDTNITLEAEGDPTTFSMSVDVLSPPNDIMMELKQYDVDEDKLHGGTRIIPQKSNYTYTPTTIIQKETVGFDNPEMY